MELDNMHVMVRRRASLFIRPRAPALPMTDPYHVVTGPAPNVARAQELQGFQPLQRLPRRPRPLLRSSASYLANPKPAYSPPHGTRTKSLQPHSAPSHSTEPSPRRALLTSAPDHQVAVCLEENATGNTVSPHQGYRIYTRGAEPASKTASTRSMPPYAIMIAPSH